MGYRTSATQGPLFCSGLINRSAYLIRFEVRKGGPSVHQRSDKSDKRPASKFTHPRRGSRYDKDLWIEDLIDLDIEHRLHNPTSKHVASVVDHLLRSGKGVDDVIHLGDQTRVPEHRELVDPQL